MKFVLVGELDQLDSFLKEFLINAAKRKKIDLLTIKFHDVYDALSFDQWGDINIILKSGLNKNFLNLKILVDKLRLENKFVLNFGKTDSLYWRNKYYQQLLLTRYLKKYNFPVKAVKTFLVSDYLSQKQLKQIIKKYKFNFPLVVKPNYGSLGKGVKLIFNEFEIKTIKKDEIIQPLIGNGSGFRIFCLGGVVLFSYYKEPKKGDFRNNIAQGGILSEIKDKGLKEITDYIALGLSGLFNLTSVGVDLLIDDKGNLYFGEVNSLSWWDNHELKFIRVEDYEDYVLNLFNLIANRNKKNLENLVFEYLDYNDDLLSFIKRIHFYQRMFLFFKSEYFLKKLIKEKNNYLCDLNIKKMIKNIKSQYFEFRNSVLHEKYENIFLLNRILFRNFFSNLIFGIDLSKRIIDYFGLEIFLNIAKDIIENPDYLIFSGSSGINFLYNVRFLLSQIGKDNEFKFNLEQLIKIAESVEKNLENKERLKNIIYFYTHLIINESGFYSRKLDSGKRVYRHILKKIENLIEKNYFNVSLDCKFEFLVCCKILNYSTPLFSVIYSEAKRSLSDIGNYLIDRHNVFAEQRHMDNLALSEHRNALFIMAFKDKLSK